MLRSRRYGHEPMNQGAHPEEPPAEVLDDVARVVGAEVTLLGRLPGGVNGGATRVQLAGGAQAVLKAVPRAHPDHLDETLRAQRVVEHRGARLSHRVPRRAADGDHRAPGRHGAVVAVVDIGNAGSGTRAIDLTTLLWYSFEDPLLDDVRRRLWTRILDLVDWEGAAVLKAAHILHMLEIPVRLGRHDVVPGVVERGHRALDELDALR